MKTKNRAVVKYANGTILKGHAASLFRFSRVVEFVPLDEQDPVQINVREIKAIFFVKTFQGRKFSLVKSRERSNVLGRRGNVIFRDGEKVEGFVQAYNHQDPLVQVVPVSLNSNNEMIFCSRAAIDKIDWLDKKKDKKTVRTEDYL
jgi:Family of unknown function (DUF6982)